VYEKTNNTATSPVSLVWNTLAMEKIVAQLRATGHDVQDEHLARISPLLHQHVIPNGTYRFPSQKAG